MPTATKRDATTLRPVPKSDRVAELALTASDGTSRGEGTQTSVQQPSAGPTPTQLAQFMAPLRPSGSLGSREDIQDELNAIALAVRSFPMKQPDQVMREVAAYSARLTELTVLLHRHEDYDRQYARVRTMQVAKWLEELDRQFKIASRLVEVMRQDLELMR